MILQSQLLFLSYADIATLVVGPNGVEIPSPTLKNMGLLTTVSSTCPERIKLDLLHETWNEESIMEDMLGVVRYKFGEPRYREDGDWQHSLIMVYDMTNDEHQKKAIEAAGEVVFRGLIKPILQISDIVKDVTGSRILEQFNILQRNLLQYQQEKLDSSRM